jgi:hypothetical protein
MHPISSSNLRSQRALEVQLASAWYFDLQSKQLVVNCFLQFEEIGVDPNIKMYALIKV